MADITGAPPPFMAGGKTSGGGPKTDIYSAKVTAVTNGVSTAKGTPFIELELQGHKDKKHPEREGKALLKQRWYGPNPKASSEDAEAAKGRLKNQLFKPLGVTWPKDEKKFDVRAFLNKEVTVLIGQSKANGDFDARAEVKRITLTSNKDAVEKMQKALDTLLDKANVDQSEDGSSGESSDDSGDEKPKRSGGR